MLRFALPIAVIAWLFSSLMPAFALASAHAHGAAISVLEAMPKATAAMDAHPGHDHATAHPHTVSQMASASHCPDCTDTPAKPEKPACAMSLCAACTSLVPDLMLATVRPAMAGRLIALAIPPLAGMAPGPADPPPRI